MAVAKIVELIGGSSKGFDDALNQVILRAKKTVRNITGLEIISQKIKFNKDKSLEYRVNAKVLFLIEDKK